MCWVAPLQLQFWSQPTLDTDRVKSLPPVVSGDKKILVLVTVGDWAMVTLHRPPSVTSALRKMCGKDVLQLKSFNFSFNMQYYMSY